MANPSKGNATDVDQLILQAGTSEAVRELSRRGEMRRYRRGAVLAEEGDVGETLFIILQGRLRVGSRHLSTGREVVYGVYGPGEFVGEMSLDGGPRSAYIEVQEDVICVRVSRPLIEMLLAEHPEFAFELLSKVIRRARAATLSLKQMALNDVYGRLRALLETMAQPRADGTRMLSEPLSHLEIAQRIGCGREMVSRVLKDLERGGYVARGPGRRLVVTTSLPARW